MTCPKQCDGCAFKPGAAANKEPDNRLRGRLAVLGPFPFVCHESFDYDDPAGKVIRSKADYRAKGVQICGGWSAEVKALAATGYYKENREITKGLAQAGFDTLNDFLSIKDDQEMKDEARAILERIVKLLGRKVRKFHKSPRRTADVV